MQGAVLENFSWHASHREGPGASVFTARVAQTLIDVLDESSALGRRVLTWRDLAESDALALRVLAAFHALARTGTVPPLTAVYPPAQASDTDLAAAIRAAIAVADPTLTAFIDRPPQTNETGRSAIVLGACLLLAERFGWPIALYEIGSSAGLNLRLADYGYTLGDDRVWGPPDPPLTLVSDWTGTPPSAATKLVIAGAEGCDITPLDPASDADAERMMAYVWADQTDRLARMQAAIANARKDAIRVSAVDAADWVEDQLSRPAPAHTTRLVFHTFVWTYLPQETRDRITRAMERAGAAATARTPLALFGVENDKLEEGSAAMSLHVWPGNQQLSLGRAQYHGRWARWTMDRLP